MRMWVKCVWCRSKNVTQEDGPGRACISQTDTAMQFDTERQQGWCLLRIMGIIRTIHQVKIYQQKLDSTSGKLPENTTLLHT